VATNVLSWPANPPSDNVTAYKVYGALGASVAFNLTDLLATVTALTWTHTGLGYAETWTYYLVAANVIGDSAPTGPLNLTTVAMPGTVEVTASEDIAAKDFTNIFDDAGDMRIRLADATDPDKFANSFAPAAIANGASGTAQLAGINPVVIATTTSRVWLSETVPGGFQTTPPVLDGSINQPLGPAMPDIGIDFTMQPFTRN